MRDEGTPAHNAAEKGHSEVLTLLVYIGAIVALSSPMLLDSTFDLQFILTVDFAWRTALLTAVATSIDDETAAPERTATRQRARDAYASASAVDAASLRREHEAAWAAR